MNNMEVLSVSEAWAVAKEIVGSAEIIGSSTSYYGNVAQLMQANGWTAVTKGSEVLYYTRPAQVAIESGVKAYTEVATVSDVAVAESGAVTSATATTTGIGVTVAKSAIAGAAAACFGYNVGTKIYDSNPEFWDGLLNEVNEWTVENVPEGGVNAIVSVLNGIDTVLTLPESLLSRIKAYSINAGFTGIIYSHCFSVNLSLILLITFIVSLKSFFSRTVITFFKSSMYNFATSSGL